MRPDPKKCCVLVPSRDGIDQACERGLYELARRGYPLAILRGVTSIDQIRCQMATDALERGFEELFWIDDDIVFDPDDVDRLRVASYEMELSILGGVYPKKGEPQLTTRWKDGTNSVVLGKGGGILEVKYTSTGFLLTHASVYSRMLAQGVVGGPCVGQFGRRMIPYFQPMIVSQDGLDWYLAEDWSFCHRSAQAGVAIWVDTRPRLLHVGRYAYSWDDLGARERAASVIVQIAEPGPTFQDQRDQEWAKHGPPVEATPDASGDADAADPPR